MDRDPESPKTSSSSAPTKGSPPDGKDPMRGEGTRVLAAGMTFAASMALFALGGYWLDGQFGSQPWLTLVGCLFGLVGGTIHLLNAVAPGTLPFGKDRPSENPAESDDDSKPDDDDNSES